MLEIDCGLKVNPEDADYHSGATDMRGKSKKSYTFPVYTIFVQCPHKDAKDPELSNIKLTVPDDIDLEHVSSLKEAEKLVLSGNVYTCNFRGTATCPLTSKKS